MDKEWLVLFVSVLTKRLIAAGYEDRLEISFQFSFSFSASFAVLACLDPKTQVVVVMSTFHWRQFSFDLLCFKVITFHIISGIVA